jgi:hypothetical protein
MWKHAEAHLATTLDYLILLRPRQFAEALRRVKTRRYLEPHAYLLGNLVLTAFAALLAEMLFADEPRQDLGFNDQVLALGFATCVVAYNGLVCVLAAKIVAFTLALPSRARVLFDALCYSTAFLPLTVLLNAWFFSTLESTGFRLAVYVLGVFVGLTWIIFFSTTAGRFLRLKSAFYWRFALLTTFLVLATQTATAWPIMGHLLEEQGRLRATGDAAAQKIPGCSSHELRATATTDGAPLARAWFEWGPGHTLTYRTPVQVFYQDSKFTQMITGLPEGSLFSYQAVVENAYGTARGDKVTLLTSACRVGETDSLPTK